MSEAMNDSRSPALSERDVFEFTKHGFEEALHRLGWRIRFDERAQRLDAKLPDSDSWVPYTDVVAYQLRDEARVCFANDEAAKPRPYNLIERDMKEFPRLVGQDHACDAWFEDYIQRLKPWDKEPRVEGLLEHIWPDCLELNPEFGDKAAEMARWIGRYLFVGPLQRADEPGSDLREIPVLIGPQRGGKSSLVEWLACRNKNWFTDGVALDNDRKTNDESTAGKVYVEIAEMTGYRKADIERMKVWLTSHQDGAQRAAYGKFVNPYLHRWVAVGTANDTGSGTLPNDPSGNSRFVAFRVGHAENQPHTLNDEFRDQCFAEALYPFKAGVDGWTDGRLPRELWEGQRRANKVHASANMCLEDAVDALDKDWYTPKDLVNEVMHSMPGEGARPSERQVWMAAKAAGWERGKKLGKRVWVRPVSVAAQSEGVNDEPF